MLPIPKHVAVQAEQQAAADVATSKYKRGRFIPVTKRDLEALLARHVEPDAEASQDFREVCRLLDDQDAYDAMSVAHNPYGDGKAVDRILNRIRQYAAEQ